MFLLKQIFDNGESLLGIRKIDSDENQLTGYCSLNDVDNVILNDCSSVERRLEILNVRALIKDLGLDLKITYKHRKPIANFGKISISHSDSLVAVIWSKSFEYAIDIEEVAERITRISKRAFSNSELEFAEGNLIKLNLMWNCKESVYKIAENKGLSFKEQIRVHPFADDKKIMCEMIIENEKSFFEFEYGMLENHTFVYGKVKTD